MGNSNVCLNCGGFLRGTTSDGEVAHCDTCCVTSVEGKIYYGGVNCECESHEPALTVLGTKLNPDEEAIR